MGHGQYLVYSSKSSIFEECIIFFPFFRNIANDHFLKSVLSFSKSQLNFQKIKMSRILLPLRLNLVVAHIYRILQVFMGYQLTMVSSSMVSLDRSTTAHFLYIATGSDRVERRPVPTDRTMISGALRGSVALPVMD